MSNTYTLPLHGVNTRNGTTAAAVDSRIDGGSIKLIGEKVHRRFRKTEPTNVMGFPEMLVGVVDGTLPAQAELVGEVDLLEGLNPLKVSTAVEIPSIVVGSIVGVNIDGEVLVGFVTYKAGSTFWTDIEAPEDAEGGFEIYLFESAAVNDPLITPPKPNIERDSIHSVNAVRTVKTATAIRDGNYNIFTGDFDPQPGESNDFPSMGSDEANDEYRFAFKSVTGVEIGGE